MAITMEKLIEALNNDLAWEYAAAIQYVQHAACIKGAKYESILKELLIHSQEEMQHAVSLSDQINFLGGTPTVNVEKREVSDKSLEMLKQDLAGEEYAIERYKERIAQAEELREYGLRRALEDILIMEEEHKRDLQTVVEEE
ncbi:MAG: bacterioferritin [Thermodesulfobacteriota bacterium]